MIEDILSEIADLEDRARRFHAGVWRLDLRAREIEARGGNAEAVWTQIDARRGERDRLLEEAGRLHRALDSLDAEARGHPANWPCVGGYNP